MSTFVVSMIVGWSALVASWIAPRFIKNETDKLFICSALAAFATGVFVGNLIYTLMK